MRLEVRQAVDPDATAVDLFAEAERLAREGNLRGAIRKGYIALLCELADRRVIGLAQHKTNRDYLRDVRKRHALYQNMSGLTDNFERHWYGFEKADEKDWEEFNTVYKTVFEPPYPARAVVGAGLRGILVEISAIAWIAE